MADAIEVSAITVSPTTVKINSPFTITATVKESAITIPKVPSYTGSLTYTGSSQKPNWVDYDSNQLTMSGTTQATNAGSYSTTFTPKTGYQWSDGTTNSKSVSWSIAKASDTMTLSPTSVTLDYSTKSKAVSVTIKGTGAITATSSSTSYVTATVSGKTVTVKAVARGSATVTIKSAASTNYNSVSKTLSVTVNYPYSTLSSNSWSTISQVSKAGEASKFWKVGDTKTITFDGLSCKVAILGFDFDKKTGSSSKAGISFGLIETPHTEYEIGDAGPYDASAKEGGTGSSSAGPLDTDFVKSLNSGEIYGKIDSSIKSYLVAVDKPTRVATSYGDKGDNLQLVTAYYSMKIFPFSIYDLGGYSTTYPQYPYFKSDAAHLILPYKNPSVASLPNSSPYYLRDHGSSIFAMTCITTQKDRDGNYYTTLNLSASPYANKSYVRFGFCI